jgi:hypothetical protein
MRDIDQGHIGSATVLVGGVMAQVGGDISLHAGGRRGV